MKNWGCRVELVERGREAGEIVLGLVEEVEGVGLQRAVGGELQVGLGVDEDGRGVVLEFVNPGEQDVGVGLAGIES